MEKYPRNPVTAHIFFLKLNWNFKLVFKSLGPKESTILVGDHNNFDFP